MKKQPIDHGPMTDIDANARKIADKLTYYASDMDCIRAGMRFAAQECARMAELGTEASIDDALAERDRPDQEILERAAEICDGLDGPGMTTARSLRRWAGTLRAQAARETDDLTQEEKLRRLLIRAEEAIQFMTGSIDFGPGGQAHDGFVRLVHPLRKEIHDAVREAPDQSKAARESDPFEAAAQSPEFIGAAVREMARRALAGGTKP